MIRLGLLALAIFLTGCAAPAPARAEDPALVAAEKEARAQFPRFARRFQAGAPGEKFSVKAPFEAGNGYTEYMWLRVTRLEEGKIHGLLESQPLEVKGLRTGDPVTVPVSTLSDWIVLDPSGKTLEGGYTVKVLRER